MKSLEEVIKQKRKFIGNSREPYELYNLLPYSYLAVDTDIRLFLTNNDIISDNIMTLLEEMTPLLVYIFSCIRHCDSSQFRDITIKLKFPNSEVIFDECIDLSSYLFLEPIGIIKENIDGILASGHYISFLTTFRLEITIVRESINEFIFHPSEGEDEDEPLIINEVKTFKTDECVICLENKNNVLFCNCGHICVCEKCIEIKRLTKCPVCKTKNTILRIIE